MPCAALPGETRGPCTSQQGLLGENRQPGAAMLLLKTQAKPGEDEREFERENRQGKWKEHTFWIQTHLYWNHGSWVVFHKSCDFSELQFPHLQNEIIVILKGFPKKPADGCTEMHDGQRAYVHRHVSLHEQLVSLGFLLFRSRQFLSNSETLCSPLFNKTSSQDSININGMVNTV